MRSISRSRAGAAFDASATSSAMTAYPSIADRANGGTSIGDRTSVAATRPPASSRRTRSVRAIGRRFAARRRRASSSGIVEVNGRIRNWNAYVQRQPRKHEDAKKRIDFFFVVSWLRGCIWRAALSRSLLHEMSELRNEEPFHRETHGRLGSRQGHY